MYLPQYKVSVFWNGFLLCYIVPALDEVVAIDEYGDRIADFDVFDMRSGDSSPPTFEVLLFSFTDNFCSQSVSYMFKEDRNSLYTKKKKTTHQFTSDKILYISTYALKHTWMQTAWIFARRPTWQNCKVCHYAFER